MGDAVASASVIVEQGSVAQDMSTQATALAGESGIASATLDPGASGIVEIDIVADAGEGTKGVWILDLDTSAGGTFYLTVNGVPTAPIAYDATDEEIGDALEALPNVNSVTVSAGSDDGDIQFDDPIEDIVVTVVDIDLTTPGTIAITEDTEAVAPSASAGSSAITAAIAAVDDVQLRGAITTVADPVVSLSGASASITEAESTSFTVSSTLTTPGAVVSLHYVSSGVEAALPSWARIVDKGDPVRGTNANAGQAVVYFNPASADVDGTHVFVVKVTDDNGEEGFGVFTLTITDPS